jgi:hypothetical protein
MKSWIAGPLLAGLVASFAPAAETPDAATNGVYLSPASAQSGGGGRAAQGPAARWRATLMATAVM